MEFLDHDGCNLYGIDLQKAEGLTFEEASLRISGGVLLGFCSNGKYRINPAPGSVIERGDKLLVFTGDPDAISLTEEADVMLRLSDRVPDEKTLEDILILGVNEEITTVLQELPSNTGKVRIAGANDEYRPLIEECVRLLQDGEHRNMSVEMLSGTVPDHPETLAEIIRGAGHVVLLNDHEKDEDEADTENIMRLLNLKAIRREKALSFSITTELRRELSQRLADTGDNTDFVVASNMVSLFLSQLADSPDLESVFRELLSSDGNEIYLKSAEELCLAREITVQEARKAALRKGCVLLGIMHDENGMKSSLFDPPLDRLLSLDDKDSLIVISKD